MGSHIELDNASSDSSDDEEEEQYVFVPVPDADRFATDDDDLFMRSVLANYVQKDGTVGKAEATACAKEVLCTHKKICGADLDAYLPPTSLRLGDISMSTKPVLSRPSRCHNSLDSLPPTNTSNSCSQSEYDKVIKKFVI